MRVPGGSGSRGMSAYISSQGFDSQNNIICYRSLLKGHIHAIIDIYM